MKKLLFLIVVSFLMSVNIAKAEFVEDVYIKCTTNENHSNKSYFNYIKSSLSYIKFSPGTNIFFGWLNTEKDFGRKSTYTKSETHYFINKNIKFGLKNEIKISRETGFLWMGSGYGKGDPEDMKCVKMDKKELPITEVKQIF